MSLNIKQDYEYQGNDYWKWRAWIEAPAEELDRIEQVIYLLHSTFRDPVRTITDRATHFRLEEAGWGAFTLHATVHFKDGTRTRLNHELELNYPDSPPTRSGSAPVR